MARSTVLLCLMFKSDIAFLTHTTLDDRFVLRLCVAQTRTEERHVEEAWRLIRETARELAAEEK